VLLLLMILAILHHARLVLLEAVKILEGFYRPLMIMVVIDIVAITVPAQRLNGAPG
jgi:hypothetical protein